jgi:formate/nitrite transporter FocA (FNT family)
MPLTATRAREQSEQAKKQPDELTTTLQRTVDEGVVRVTRTWPSLLATGFVGGADVAIGVFALFIVKAETHSDLLAALAFPIGFIALTLANSELFTENYLVPIAAVLARKATGRDVVRLWFGTLVMNLIGGWFVLGLIASGFPKFHDTAVATASTYNEIGIGWRSFSGAILGGAVITLMTWMERSTDSVPAKLIAAVSAAFVLAAAPLNHVIVVSLELFGAFHYGAPFGYARWLAIAAWYTLGNMIGGIALVTGLRMVQIGKRLDIERHSNRPVPTSRVEDIRTE